MWSWFMVWDTFIQRVDKPYLKSIYDSELALTLDRMPKWSAPTPEK